SDKEYARRRVQTLQQEIDALGSEFNDAFTQTSETWHDNAPFEIVRDKQAVLYAEHQGLKGILQSALPSIPKQHEQSVGIGAVVETVSDGKSQSYFMAGDWTPFSGTKLPGTDTIVVSRVSPIAQCFRELHEGDEFIFNRKKYTVARISYGYLDQYAE